MRTVGLNDYADLAAEERVEGKIATGLVMQLALDLFVECFAEARAIQEDIGQPPLLRLIVKRHDQIGNRVRRRNFGRAERHRACLRRHWSDASQGRNEHAEPEEHGERYAARRGRPHHMRRTGAVLESSGHGDTSFLVVLDRYARSSAVFRNQDCRGIGCGRQRHLVLSPAIASRSG